MGGLTPAGHGTTTPPVLVMMAAGVARRYGGCKPLAPVGLHGEAVIDLNAGDAMRAGFGDIVLVLGPATDRPSPITSVGAGRRRSPSSSALQAKPLGTVHAVLSARGLVGDRPFAVINADDIYGVPALELLARHLASTADHALVSYRLRDTVVTSDPVTRGMCETDGDGWLRALVERRMVTRHDDGTFTADDGLEPKEPRATPRVDEPLGIHPGHLALPGRGAVPGPPGTGARRDRSRGRRRASDTEVLLPEVVGDMAGAASADDGPGRRVRVIAGTGRCIGVTHADDVPVVRMELAEMVGQGLRAEGPWGTGPDHPGRGQADGTGPAPPAPLPGPGPRRATVADGPVTEDRDRTLPPRATASRWRTAASASRPPTTPAPATAGPPWPSCAGHDPDGNPTDPARLPHPRLARLRRPGRDARHRP